jgi:hypothetical protein
LNDAIGHGDFGFGEQRRQSRQDADEGKQEQKTDEAAEIPLRYFPASIKASTDI